MTVADVVSTTLVVCIGNELVADDAVGYEVFRRLGDIGVSPAIRLAFLGVGGIALLDQLQGDEEALIVVDAVQFGAPAGTVHRLSWDRVPANGNSAISAHGIGLKEAIEVGRIVSPEKIPATITLIGIEGRCFNLTREHMTPAVAAAVPVAVSAIQEIISPQQGMEMQ